MVNLNILEVTLPNLGQKAVPLESVVFVPFAILPHITLKEMATFPPSSSSLILQS